MRHISIAITPSPEDVEANIQILLQLYTHFRILKCGEPACHTAVPLPNVKGHIRIWLAGAKSSSFPPQISGIHCKQCRKFTCTGCRGNPVPSKRNIDTNVAVVNHCCDKGRLFGIWMLLCRFDEIELGLQRRAAQNGAKNASRDNKGLGLGYTDTFLSFGTDPSTLPNYMDFRKQHDLTDTMMTEMPKILIAFIPVVDSNLSFDRHPPVELSALFRLSLLFDRVTSLMRNDSIADMTRRSSLYRSALAFVTAIAKHFWLRQDPY